MTPATETTIEFFGVVILGNTVGFVSALQNRGVSGGLGNFDISVIPNP